MEKWFVSMKKADFEAIGKKHNIDPVIARLIRNRDIIEEEEIKKYLYGTIEDLENPELLKDALKAAGIVRDKISSKSRIRIIGDYDIDGVNATYILLRALQELGAEVDYEIPDRMKDGYGINEQLIQAAYEDGIDTIITCDNGISAVDQITYAKSLGMTVIITDHHELPFREEGEERILIVPEADAVVNPKQPDCAYPFKELCGAAVAFRFMEVLYAVLGRGTENIGYLIENVAIATVGDVMDLRGENRIYVRTGLGMLEKTENYGLKALIEVNNLNKGKLTAFHIGFVIGPCLNASGRLDTAKRALQLLCSESRAEADRLAGDLKALNDSRKEMTVKGVEEAICQIESGEMRQDKVLVVYLPDCHESLAGIIAGRIRERYHKPVFVLTDAEDGVKGSGRSIESFHMFDEMNRCRELFTKFGGHPMAAGLSMKREDVETLRSEMNRITNLTEEDLIPKVSIDIAMPIDYIEEGLIRQIDLLEPFGKGNPKPLFAEKDLELQSARILGKNKNVLKLQVRSKNGRQMEAMHFGDPELFAAYISEKYGQEEMDKAFAGVPNRIRLMVTYYPGINEYMGDKKLQITIQNYQ